MSPAAQAPIGLLGGSFDPVHIGHLQLARAAQQALGLGTVVFIPAGQPWQKGSPSPAADRVRMLQLALAPHPGWRIDTREVERPGSSYTVETLLELRRDSGAAQSLVWITGFDQLRRLPTWHRWEELIGLAHIAYARRAGTAQDLDPVMQDYTARHAGTAGTLRERAAGSVVEFPMPPVDCSASAIRRALAAGDEAAVAPYVPAAVLDDIRTHQRYHQVHGQ
jgi:nicotinate-nucleotide adenylyltransferase